MALERSTSEPTLSRNQLSNIIDADRVDAKTTERADVDEPVDMRMLDYVSDYDDHLTCYICRCPFIDPVSLPCRHTFCKGCLDDAEAAQSSRQKTCPTCRRPFGTGNRQQLPRFLGHILDDLLVRCPNHNIGCEAQLRRGEVQRHLSRQCQLTPTPCPDANCSLKVPRSQRTSGCLHQEVQCSACESTMMQLDLKDHEFRRCRKKTYSCGHCGDELSCSSRDEHESTCPSVETKCSGSVVGCKFTSTRDRMKAHTRFCALSSLAPHMQSLQDRMDGQAREMRSLRTKNELLESRLETLQGVADGGSGGIDSSSSNVYQQEAPFDSTTHHVLSMNESLREDLDRASAAISDVDARLNMMILNETHRMREDMLHQNAVIGRLQTQIQWLLSAKLQAQARGPAHSTGAASGAPATSSAAATALPAQPTRRLSDPTRQEVKL